jgi:hypothetical protein
MNRTVYHGIVRGKNIELDEAPLLPNGEPVTVEIQSQRAAGDGIRASSGAWADAGEELDHWLGKIYQARHTGRTSDSK